MAKPNKTDNFGELVSTLQSIKRYHKQYSDVKKYYGLAENLVHAYRKPSASTIYNATLGIVEEVATKNPMGKLIFSMHGPHLKILGAALQSSDKFEGLQRSTNQFSKSLEKLEGIKRRYRRDFKYNPRIHGEGIISYMIKHNELFHNTESDMVQAHGEKMIDHVTYIVESMDYFLWYYVRIKPHYKKLKDAIKEARKKPESTFDVIFGGATQNNFNLQIELKMKGDNYGSGVSELIKTRNHWAKWLSKSTFHKSVYLNSSKARFGGTITPKKIKKDPSLFRQFKELVGIE